MKQKRSEKETRYLRELVGGNGEKAHYFNPDTKQSKTHNATRGSVRAAKQIAEMREAAGTAKRERNK